jgi:hypothetical protein
MKRGSYGQRPQRSGGAGAGTGPGSRATAHEILADDFQAVEAGRAPTAPVGDGGVGPVPRDEPRPIPVPRLRSVPSTPRVQSTVDECDGPRRDAMPPNEPCPNCHRLVADWHVEWYKTEGPSLYKGLAALDCPLCRQPVSFQGGKIGSAPPGVPVVTRHADQAAQWAASQAVSAGGTLQGYTSVAGAGIQYAAYWTPQEVLQADGQRRAKRGGP